MYGYQNDLNLPVVGCRYVRLRWQQLEEQAQASALKGAWKPTFQGSNTVTESCLSILLPHTSSSVLVIGRLDQTHVLVRTRLRLLQLGV